MAVLNPRDKNPNVISLRHRLSLNTTHRDSRFVTTFISRAHRIAIAHNTCIILCLPSELIPCQTFKVLLHFATTSASKNIYL